MVRQTCSLKALTPFQTSNDLNPAMLAHKWKPCSLQTHSPLSLCIWYKPLHMKKYACLIVLKMLLTIRNPTKEYSLTPKICYVHFPFPRVISKNPLNSIICKISTIITIFNLEETTSDFSLKKKMNKDVPPSLNHLQSYHFYCKGRKLVKIMKTQFHTWH